MKAIAKQRGARVLAGVRGKDVEQARELKADGVVAIDRSRSGFRWSRPPKRRRRPKTGCPARR